MEHQLPLPDAPDATPAALLALLTFVTCTALALTEQFAQLPAALAAYASAYFILRL